MLLQGLGEELESSRRKWQADLARSAERLHAASAKVRTPCACRFARVLHHSQEACQHAAHTTAASVLHAGLVLGSMSQLTAGLRQSVDLNTRP